MTAADSPLSWAGCGKFGGARRDGAIKTAEASAPPAGGDYLGSEEVAPQKGLARACL